jgi:3-phosphoshikimate 1-carboxyvinyltransferase
MAAAVLAKFADGPCVVEDPDCVRVSFPGFFDVLSSLR